MAIDKNKVLETLKAAGFDEKFIENILRKQEKQAFNAEMEAKRGVINVFQEEARKALLPILRANKTLFDTEEKSLMVNFGEIFDPETGESTGKSDWVLFYHSPRPRKKREPKAEGAEPKAKKVKKSEK